MRSLLPLVLATIVAAPVSAQLILTGNNVTIEYPGNGTSIPANTADANGWYYVNGSGTNGFATPQVGYVKRQTCNGQPVDATVSFASNVNYPGNCSSTAQHGEAHDFAGGVPVGCAGNDKYLMMRGKGTASTTELIAVVHNLDVPVLAGQWVVFRGWLGYKRGVVAFLTPTNFQMGFALGNTTDGPVTLPPPVANSVTLTSTTMPTSNCMTWAHPVESILATQSFNRIIFYVRMNAPANAVQQFYWDDLEIAAVTPMAGMLNEDGSLNVNAALGLGNTAPTTFTKALTAWPVPANDEVIVALPVDAGVEGRVTLFDTMGRELWSTTTKGTRCIVPLSNVPVGHYLVRFVADDRSSTVRVQKE